MVTIYDIAKASGFAPATVSKTLNNYAGVNDKTRKKIFDTAKELGYTPSAAARLLTTKRSFNIGVLIFIDDTVDLTHYLFIRILNRFKNVLDQHGYDITLISKADNNLNKNAFLNHCKMRQVDGILLFGDYSCPPMQEILKGDIPVVGFDYLGDLISGISSDNYIKMNELTTKLISLGHRRIKYFCGNKNYVTDQRVEGFKDAFREAGIWFEPSFVTETQYSNPQCAMEETLKMANESIQYTAVIYSDDYSAVGGVRALNSVGKKIPSDISVASFDGIEFSTLTEPNLTTVKQNTDKIGEVLAEKLLSLINGESSTEIITVPASIIYTQSIAERK